MQPACLTFDSTKSARKGSSMASVLIATELGEQHLLRSRKYALPSGYQYERVQRGRDSCSTLESSPHPLPLSSLSARCRSTPYHHDDIATRDLSRYIALHPPAATPCHPPGARVVGW